MQKTPTLLFGKVSNSDGYKGDFKISSLFHIQKISEIKFIFIKINGCQIPFHIDPTAFNIVLAWIEYGNRMLGVIVGF